MAIGFGTKDSDGATLSEVNKMIFDFIHALNELIIDRLPTPSD
jgi:hypothetical protein